MKFEVYQDTSTPIAVYDIEDKKLVLLFRSRLRCEQYVFGAAAGSNSSRMSRYVSEKTRCHKNMFGRLICFRDVSKQHAETLGDKQIVILDERYDRKEWRANKHSQSIELKIAS